jgi:hypothetical protein
VCLQWSRGDSRLLNLKLSQDQLQVPCWQFVTNKITEHQADGSFIQETFRAQSIKKSCYRKYTTLERALLAFPRRREPAFHSLRLSMDCVLCGLALHGTLGDARGDRAAHFEQCVRREADAIVKRHTATLSIAEVGSLWPAEAIAALHPASTDWSDDDAFAAATSEASASADSSSKRACADLTTDRDVSEILPGLFLGAAAAAYDAGWLTTHGICTVVNCAAECLAPPALTCSAAEAVRLDMEDEWGTHGESNEPRIVRGAQAVADASSRGGGSVLVHCVAGRSRSVSVMLAYLVLVRACIHVCSARQLAGTTCEPPGLCGRPACPLPLTPSLSLLHLQHEHMTLLSAVSLVRRRRPSAAPVLGLWRILSDIEGRATGGRHSVPPEMLQIHRQAIVAAAAARRPPPLFGLAAMTSTAGRVAAAAAVGPKRPIAVARWLAPTMTGSGTSVATAVATASGIGAVPHAIRDAQSIPEPPAPALLEHPGST